MVLLFIHLFFSICSLFDVKTGIDKPVFSNPGVKDESFVITDFIDVKQDYVLANVSIQLKESAGRKTYQIKVTEGDYYLNEITLNFSDLTTIYEQRTDLTTNLVIEYFSNLGKHKYHLFQRDKNIDKVITAASENVYSRYAYFVSFRGFPFKMQSSVEFTSFMFEYGDLLPMKLKYLETVNVKVKGGSFPCYKMELSVAGWQSVFAGDKYYLYFGVSGSHPFIKYEEGNKKGGWNTNELVKTLNE